MKNIKVFIRKMYHLILYIFNIKYKINSSKVRRNILLYATYTNPTNKYFIDSMTNIKVYKKRRMYLIYLESHYPGIVIGKEGKYIFGLEKFLKQELKSNIEIIILQSYLWTIFL